MLLVLLVLIWFLIHLTALIAQKYYNDTVNQFLRRKGFSLRPFQLRYSTTVSSDIFASCTSGMFACFFSIWFRIGSIVTVLSIPASFYILLRTLLSSLWSRTAAPGPSLEAVLPGVNLPVSEIGFYIVSIVCASIIHEVGHAIAAAAANVPVEGVGFAVFAIVPVAFVELSTDSFNRVHVTRRLGIVCAGVWHNFTLALLCAILLLGHPVLLFPICAFGSGSTVTSQSSEQNALTSGDLIESVNGCPVTGKQSWRNCLTAISQQNVSGYCLTHTFLKTERFHSLDPNQCCVEDLARNLCFTDQQGEKFCLPARKVVDHSSVCADDTECPYGSRCLKPETGDNRTRLFRVSRKSAKSFIFAGYAHQLLISVQVIDCKPRVWWAAAFLFQFYDSFLRYLLSFSLALAVLNVVPCFFLDGQFILLAAVELTSRDRMSRINQKKLCRVLSAAGSVLLMSCVASAFVNLIAKNTAVHDWVPL